MAGVYAVIDCIGMMAIIAVGFIAMTLFRGHPARPYYATTDGAGYLLVALLQLDRAVELKDKLVGQKTIPLTGNAAMGFDNW